MWNKHKKRLFCLFFLIAAALTVSGLTLYSRINSMRLSRLETAIVQNTFAADTLSLHFTIAVPESWELGGLPAALPVYSAEYRSASDTLLQQYLQDFSQIKTQFLSDEEALRYELLTEYLGEMQESSRFPFYNEVLSPSSGAQSQFPILMAEFPFRDKEDVEHYLDLLSQTDIYFDGLIAYEQERAAEGMFMSDESALAVIRQCSSVFSKAALADGSHFLSQTFAERLEPLLSSGMITEEEKERYISENGRLLTTVVAPAYEKLADALFLLMGDHPQTTGLASLPDGRAYYSHLVARTTGSDKSVSELRELLISRLQEDFHALALLSIEHQSLLSDSEALSSLSKRTAELLPDTADEMILDLKSQMIENFPALPSGNIPSPDSYIHCNVKSVSDSLEPYVSPAYYFTPPVDNVQNNTIYINHSQTPEGLVLYTTLAHEGYPGHLYQSVFFRLSEDPSLPPVRSLYYYGGYIEGWALYVEMLSYDYAKNTMQASGSGDALTDLICTVERLDRDMQLCLYALLDISIHYDGATLEEVQSLLSRFGLSYEMGAAVYRYIAEEPANYLKYFVGYLEILECKEYARMLWGTDYSDKTFHTFFLQTGPCSFTLLKEQIFQYGRKQFG